jgi:excisionase family DNA binding protein
VTPSSPSSAPPASSFGNVVADFCIKHGLSMGDDATSMTGALLSQQDAARYLGVGSTLYYQVRKKGELKFVRVEGKLLVTRESLDAYVRRLKKTSDPPLKKLPTQFKLGRRRSNE